VFGALLGRRPSRERPDLESWIAGASPTLVVDGSGPGLESAETMFPGRPSLRHETSGGRGLPFHFPDQRRLAPPGDEVSLHGAIALVDVLDKVIDVGPAVDDAVRLLTADGVLVVVQSVAPDDFEQRAVWNAVARLRDPRQTWTPSARQFATIASGLGLRPDREATWSESVDAATTLRPELATQLASLVADADARSATEVVRDGAFHVVRRAVLLRRK
jgi:hypothetical protein